MCSIFIISLISSDGGDSENLPSDLSQSEMEKEDKDWGVSSGLFEIEVGDIFLRHSATKKTKQNQPGVSKPASDTNTKTPTVTEYLPRRASSSSSSQSFPLSSLDPRSEPEETHSMTYNLYIPSLINLSKDSVCII